MPGYIAVGVRDLAASRRFWREGLGLVPAGEWPGQLALSAGAFDILLDATGEIASAPGIEIALHLSRADLDAAVAQLAAIGHRCFRGPKDFGGPNGFEAAFRDPDGIIVTLFTGAHP